MIRFSGKLPNNQRFIMGLGLSEWDIEGMIYGRTSSGVIVVRLEDIKIPLPVDVMVFGGKDNQKLLEKLEKMPIRTGYVQTRDAE